MLLFYIIIVPIYRFNYQVREQIKDEERMHNDDSSELGSSDADGDSAVEENTSSVDSVDLNYTPGWTWRLLRAVWAGLRLR